jgi:hypothetical protein
MQTARPHKEQSIHCSSQHKEKTQGDKEEKEIQEEENKT